jgi:hypothetical protein
MRRMKEEVAQHHLLQLHFLKQRRCRRNQWKLESGFCQSFVEKSAPWKDKGLCLDNEKVGFKGQTDSSHNPHDRNLLEQPVR